MDLFARFRGNADVTKQMIALSDFYNLIGSSDLGINTYNRANTYLHKREMHGVLNCWPFNVIEYVGSEDNDVDKFEKQLANIRKSEQVRRFIEGYGTYIKSLKEHHVLAHGKLDCEKILLSHSVIWDSYTNPEVNTQALKRLQNINEKLIELEKDINGVDHYLSEILTEVHLALAVKKIDGQSLPKIPVDFSGKE